MLLMLLHTSLAQAFTKSLPLEASQAAYSQAAYSQAAYSQAGSSLFSGHLPRARDREGAFATGLPTGQPWLCSAACRLHLRHLHAKPGKQVRAGISG